MKYLVMECHEDYAVLLDEEAGFVKAKNTGLTVGETIENPQFLPDTSVSHRSIIMKVTYGLAAAAACVAVAFGINYYNEYMTPYSNIRLSINPDVEMTLNHHGQVLSVKGLNEDGEMLIDGYDPKRQDKLVVADDLIERAIDMGFLSDDAIIIFDIDTPDQNLLTQYGIELRSEAEIYTHEFANVNIIIIDRKQETTEKHEYNDADYEPIIIPIPKQTESENTAAAPPPTVVNPVPSDSGYAENSGGDSHYAADDGDSHYGNTATTAVQETTPPMTAPPATNPPSTSPPAAAPSYGDSDYEADSGYGDSMYEAESDYDASDYS